MRRISRGSRCERPQIIFLLLLVIVLLIFPNCDGRTKEQD
jgi:hypothetical protein